MSRIEIAPSPARWVVRAGGSILAETSRALELREGSYAPVIYVPRDDVAMQLMERTSTSTHCPWKGDATYYSFVGQEGTVADAAWSYEAPIDDAAPIRDHLAFYPSKVTVERA